ncbi:PAP18, partial [Symbiodinium microadriaticum]
DGCTLVALQRGAVKRTHDEEAEKPRSDRPTKSFTSSYRRPKMIADSPASKFIVNK